MKPASERHDIVGIIVLLVGAGILALGSGVHPPLLAGAHAPTWVLLAVGGIFTLPGLILLSQGRTPPWLQALLGNCVITLFAIVPAWVAWGGDPRAFSSAAGFFGLFASFSFANFGRIVFAGSALLIGLVACFIWLRWISGLSWAGRGALAAGAVLVAYLLLAVMPAEPHWPGLRDDHERLARYALMFEDEGWSRIDNRYPRRWMFPPWRNFEQWTKAARNRLTAARTLPEGQVALAVPPLATAPAIDGVIDEREWQGALRLDMLPVAFGSRVWLASHGRKLYLAADVPADTTAEGFDQFRFWFHLALSPWLENERAFVDRSGYVSAMRAARFPWGNNPPRSRTDRNIYEDTAGASSINGHRRFEMSLDLAESGIVPGVPFPAWLEIEGDPLRDANGKFKARTNLGNAGSYGVPLWFRVEASAGT
jgi:hypothetical protein